MKTIEQCQKLAKQLTKENKAYYDDFLSYVAKHNFWSDDENINVMLLEILQDLLQAQADGIIAEEYFGNNPQDVADELIKNIPSGSKRAGWKKIASLLSGFAQIPLVLSLMQPGEEIGLLHLLIGTVPVFLGLAMFFVFIFDMRYKQTKKNTIIKAILFGVMFALVTLVAGLSIVFLPDFYVIVPSWIRVILLTISIGWSIVPIIKSEKSGRLIQLTTAGIFVNHALLGIATHTFFEEQLSVELFGQGINLHFMIFITSTFIFLIMFCFVMVKYNKTLKNK